MWRAVSIFGSRSKQPVESAPVLGDGRLVEGQIEEGGSARGAMESRQTAGNRGISHEHPGTSLTRSRAAPLVPAQATATTPKGAGGDELTVRRRRGRPSKTGERIKRSSCYCRSTVDMNRGRALRRKGSAPPAVAGQSEGGNGGEPCKEERKSGRRRGSDPGGP